MLAWDGLRFPPPMAMEVVDLQPGYVRLAGQGENLELRFGPEKKAFDPGRDGRRLQRGAGLAASGFELCRHPGLDALPGALYGSERLYVYRFVENGLVALLYSWSPPMEEVVAFVAAMAWTPSDHWRQWRCLDLAFVSPPQMALQRAKNTPGAMTVVLKRDRSLLTLVRLVPADVILGGEDLAGVGKRLAVAFAKEKVEVTAADGEKVEFVHRGGLATALSALFSWSGGRVRGCLRHDRSSNRLLLVVERGRLMPREMYERIVESYVAVE